MKTILCFGDSNTWGYAPGENRRYSKSERWPCLLGRSLPVGWRVAEDGQPGRTTLYDDAASGFSSGLEPLRASLKTHRPELVILMLGTNDLKASFGLSAEKISYNVAKLVQEIKEYRADGKDNSAKVLLVAPAPIREKGSFARLFFDGSEEKSKQLAHQLMLRAKELGCDFFDSGEVASCCPEEGVHWPAEQHKLLAEAIVPGVLEIIGSLEITDKLSEQES